MWRYFSIIRVDPRLPPLEIASKGPVDNLHDRDPLGFSLLLDRLDPAHIDVHRPALGVPRWTWVDPLQFALAPPGHDFEQILLHGLQLSRYTGVALRSEE